MNESPVRIAHVRRVGPDQTVSAGAAAREADPDLLAAEEPLNLEIESHGRRLPLGIVMRTPGPEGDDHRLAAGLLFAEGFISAASQVVRFEQAAPGHLRVHLSAGVAIDDRLARRVLVRSSACGVCGRDAIDDLRAVGARRLDGNFSVNEATLKALPSLLRERQAVFNDTGGLHAAALCDADGAIEKVAEDIGRHNAVDKLVGDALLANALPLSRRVLVVSGRAAFEIVHKAVVAGVPILAAVGAPSSLAVEAARAFNLTLVGFLRADRFNIYSGFDRIV